MTDTCPAVILARIRRLTHHADRVGRTIHPDEIQRILDAKKC